MKMLVKTATLMKTIAAKMVPPAALRRHRERGGERLPLWLPPPWPPPRWGEVLPSGPWPPWRLEGREPLRDWISSLSVSLFFALCFRYCFCWLEHRFFYRRRSVTLIRLKFLHDFFHKLAFLRPKESSNRLTV